MDMKKPINLPTLSMVRTVPSRMPDSDPVASSVIRAAAATREQSNTVLMLEYFHPLFFSMARHSPSAGWGIRSAHRYSIMPTATRKMLTQVNSNLMGYD